MKHYLTTMHDARVYYNDKKDCITLDIYNKNLLKMAKKMNARNLQRDEKLKKRIEEICNNSHLTQTDLESSKGDKIKKNKRKKKKNCSTEIAYGSWERSVAAPSFETSGDTDPWWSNTFTTEESWYGPLLDFPFRRYHAMLVTAYNDPEETRIYTNIEDYVAAWSSYKSSSDVVPVFYDEKNDYLYIKPQCLRIWHYTQHISDQIIDSLNGKGHLITTKSGNPLRKLKGIKHFCLKKKDLEKFIINGLLLFDNVSSGVFYTNDISNFASVLVHILDHRYIFEEETDLEEYCDRINTTTDRVLYWEDNENYVMTYETWKYTLKRWFPGFNDMKKLKFVFSDKETAVEYLDHFGELDISHVRINLIKLCILANIDWRKEN